MLKVIAALVFLLLCVPAQAQTSQIVSCPIYDSVTFRDGDATRASLAISNCTTVIPSTGLMFFVFQGEVTCGNVVDIALTIVGDAGNGGYSPYLGSNFTGSISGSTLTVPPGGMITPPPFLIQPGQILYDTASGANIPINGQDSALSIASQTAVNDPNGPGGAGTYALNGSVSTPVGSETIWGLFNCPNCGAFAASGKVGEESVCQNGKTAIVTWSGTLSPIKFNQRLPYNTPYPLRIWFGLMMAYEGGSARSVRVQNGQIFLVAPAMPQGRGAGR